MEQTEGRSDRLPLQGPTYGDEVKKKNFQKHPKTETTTFGTLKSPQIIEHWLFFKGTPFGGAAIL